MIKKKALRYLGYKEYDSSMDVLLDEYLSELEQHIHFKAYNEVFEYDGHHILDIPINSKDAEIYFNGCHSIMIIASTLGNGVERYLKLLQKTDLTKCVIMDALASAYLEVKTDEFESFIEEKRTIRIAPGYGDLPLSLNQQLFDLLNLNKRLGIMMTESSLFIPQKTMMGLIGLGKENLNKSCMTCIKYNDCSLRKENMQCWKD